MSNQPTFGRMSVMTRAAKPGETAKMAAAAADATFTPAEEKYEIAAHIGRGGMGEVLLVEDKDLRRQVAMKVLRDDYAGDPAHRLKFVAEAQATSQLEHPGIPPVHDIGIKPSGHVYFTMKLVRGETLADVLRNLVLGSKHVRREYTLHRLASILERICEAVHFAHERGVIHRDIKPDNIMLGEYGEVHVMDWGVAKVVTETVSTGDYVEYDDGPSDHVQITGADVLHTRHGAVKGTIPYMSPEQAAGEELDRRTDVYALGCILYEMLALHPAFVGSSTVLMEKVRNGDFADVRTRNPRRPVPESLAELCESAMSMSPDDRPPTASAFAGSLRDWLDGRAERIRMHRESERLANEGLAALRRYEVLRGEADSADATAAAMATDFKPWQPVSEKAPLLAAQQSAIDLRRDMAVSFADATALLNAALAAEADNATAVRALGDLWAGRLAEAELAGNRDDAAHAFTMLGRYDDGRFAGLIAGDGTLELTSQPPGAEVLISRLVEQNGVLAPSVERSLGPTPIARTPLPMGSYLCTLRMDGFPDVRYPVHVTRGREWKASVRMRTADEIGDDFVFVPGGEYLYGEGRDAATKKLPDFAIRRTPVTFAEWGEFLAAVEADAGLDAATALIPGTKGDGEYMERLDDGTYRALPNNIEGAARERCVAEFGEGVDSLLPVAGISSHQAQEYCAWKTRVTGREWRLPTEQEREKAARGVDGRRFPWGNLPDPSLCKNAESRDEFPQPEPVGTFPTAVSIYGMVDAAGNSWDWTSSLFAPHVPGAVALSVRGGSWDYPVLGARCAARTGEAPEFRGTVVGLRPAGSFVD